jgi:hypothetical protein
MYTNYANIPVIAVFSHSIALVTRFQYSFSYAL